MVSLETLLTKFKAVKNYEHDGARHMTHVPSAGTWAYLNILFAAASLQIQNEIIDPLQLPPQVREFYRVYNGAHLFSDLLSIYGFFPIQYLYDRSDLRASYPYNLVHVNLEYTSDIPSSPIILVGSYGYDRSEVFVEKSTGVVHCGVGSDLSQLRATWPSFESWLEEEITRLADCFDECGRQLVEWEDTLPGRLI